MSAPTALKLIGAFVAVAALSACGGGTRQDAGAPEGNFTVQVLRPRFPTSQSLSEHTHLVIRIRNVSSKTIPNIAVTLCNVTCAYPAPAGQGTSAGAFAANISNQNVANPSRPLWIVDRPPGRCGYSCQGGGAGAAATAYSNTWALGPLRPGAIARFDWAVTAVAPGHHVVAWQVAADLVGKAHAVLADGSAPSGTIAVTVNSAPSQTYVNNAGQIVQAP